MRTPEQILGEIGVPAKMGLSWGSALKAIEVAQAEAAREQFEADCAAQCGFCRDGFPISVAMPKEVLFRHSLPYQRQHTVLCRAALLRRDFARRHQEVKP